MNIIKLSMLIFTIVMISCVNKSTKKTAKNNSSKSESKIINSLKINTKGNIKRGDKITLEYSFNGNIDSAFLKFENQKETILPKSSKIEITTTPESKLGSTHAILTAYKNGKAQALSVNFKLLPSGAPKEYRVVVVSTMNHSTKAYTQGLEFYKGRLYESSGQYNESYVEIKEFPSLKSVKKSYLDPKYFAEGITFFNDKLYLLTWKENTAFVMNPETLEIEKEFKYPTEGWGLTNDGEFFYMSDGTEKIYKVSTKDFSIIDYIEVTSSDGEVHSINELEWINGDIWANVYGYNVILIIDPKSGEIKGIVRFPDLLSQSEKTDETDVFNGIAFDKKNNKIYVTGKNWPKMFEIRILERK